MHLKEFEALIWTTYVTGFKLMNMQWMNVDSIVGDIKECFTVSLTCLMEPSIFIIIILGVAKDDPSFSFR